MDITSTVAIAPGVEMPRLGFGTYKAAEGAEVRTAVESALGAGYRSVDTASFYGNERGIGEAIAGVSRTDVFVTTKVWNDEQGYEGTIAALDRSLERLGLDAVDLYLVHWPIPQLAEPTWRAMETLLELGTTRAIGVCNHLEHHLDALLGFADVPPAVNQIEFHPFLQQPSLAAACSERGIVLEAWAPIMRGRVFDVPEIVEIARRHERSPAQVAINWILSKGHTTIPKSVHPKRILENADVFDFTLSTGEVATLDGLDRGERLGPDPDSFGTS